MHDAAEDQGGEVRLNDIRITFGEAVEKIVRDCSDSLGEKKPANEGDRKVEWRFRKDAYLSTLPKKPASSLLVSLADKTHNSEAIVTDVHRSGPSVWGRFTGGQDGTIWYYQELLKFFSAKMPKHVSRLDRAVSEMETLKIA